MKLFKLKQFKSAAAKIFVSQVILISSFCVCAQSYNEAKNQVAVGNYSSAYAIFKKLADEGNAEAQSELGKIYERGLGVPQDLKASFFWHLKAASNGAVYSQYVVGDMYSNGIGCNVDDSLSIYWLEKAAQNGNLDSMLNLSIAYSGADYERAYFWALKAGSVNSNYTNKNTIINIEKNLTPAQIQNIAKLIK